MKRVRFIPPRSGPFRLNHMPQNIAPGLSQIVEVEFSTDIEKEYEDQWSLVTDDGQITIPLHAYVVFVMGSLLGIKYGPYGPYGGAYALIISKTTCLTMASWFHAFTLSRRWFPCPNLQFDNLVSLGTTPVQQNISRDVRHRILVISCLFGSSKYTVYRRRAFGA